MKLSSNEGRTDRLIRVLVATIFFAVSYLWLSSTLQTIGYILAGISLFTAITGFCGLYTILGINTCKVPPKK